ncbi:unnamed protein product [Rhizophagus irregularis]|nr:unnamed protein product [Rhizophagus irregularis]CAB4417223.1 unnamed protein product [Rhizophagus irregularis]
MESAEEEEEETERDESPIQVEDRDVCIKQNDMNQELKNILSKVFVNALLECYDEMEKAYYLANFLPVCFNCKGLNFSDSTQSWRLQREKIDDIIYGKGKMLRYII